MEALPPPRAGGGAPRAPPPPSTADADADADAAPPPPTATATSPWTATSAGTWTAPAPSTAPGWGPGHGAGGAPSAAGGGGGFPAAGAWSPDVASAAPPGAGSWDAALRELQRGLLALEAAVVGSALGKPNRLHLRHTKYAVRVDAPGPPIAPALSPRDAAPPTASAGSAQAGTAPTAASTARHPPSPTAAPPGTALGPTPHLTSAPPAPAAAEQGWSRVKSWVVERRYYEFQRLRDAFQSCGFPCPELPARRLRLGHSARTEAELERKLDALDLWLQGSLAVWKSHYYGDESPDARAATEALADFLVSPGIFQAKTAYRAAARPGGWQASLRRLFRSSASARSRPDSRSPRAASARRPARAEPRAAALDPPDAGGDAGAPETPSKRRAGGALRSTLSDVLASFSKRASAAGSGAQRRQKRRQREPPAEEWSRHGSASDAANREASTHSVGRRRFAAASAALGAVASFGPAAAEPRRRGESEHDETEDERQEIDMLRRVALQDDDGADLEWTFSSEEELQSKSTSASPRLDSLPAPSAVAAAAFQPGAAPAAPVLTEPTSAPGASAAGLREPLRGRPPPREDLFHGAVVEYEAWEAAPEQQAARSDAAEPRQGAAGAGPGTLFRAVVLATNGGNGAQRNLYSSVSVPRSPRGRARFKASWGAFTDKVVTHAERRLARRLAARTPPQAVVAHNLPARALSQPLPQQPQHQHQQQLLQPDDAWIETDSEAGGSEEGSEAGRVFLRGDAAARYAERRAWLLRQSSYGERSAPLDLTGPASWGPTPESEEYDSEGSEGWASEAALASYDGGEDTFGSWEAGQLWVGPRRDLVAGKPDTRVHAGVSSTRGGEDATPRSQRAASGGAAAAAAAAAAREMPALQLPAASEQASPSPSGATSPMASEADVDDERASQPTSVEIASQASRSEAGRGGSRAAVEGAGAGLGAGAHRERGDTGASSPRSLSAAARVPGRIPATLVLQSLGRRYAASMPLDASSDEEEEEEHEHDADDEENDLGEDDDSEADGDDEGGAGARAHRGRAGGRAGSAGAEEEEEDDDADEDTSEEGGEAEQRARGKVRGGRRAHLRSGASLSSSEPDVHPPLTTLTAWPAAGGWPGPDLPAAAELEGAAAGVGEGEGEDDSRLGKGADASHAPVPPEFDEAPLAFVFAATRGGDDGDAGRGGGGAGDTAEAGLYENEDGEAEDGDGYDEDEEDEEDDFDDEDEDEDEDDDDEEEEEDAADADMDEESFRRQAHDLAEALLRNAILDPSASSSSLARG